MPVGDPEKDKHGAPLTLKVSWGAVAFIVGAGVIWWLGVVHLDEVLQIDIKCDDQRNHGRGAELGEIARCSIEEGLAGWLYLAWLAIYPLGLTTYLERSLRKTVVARRHIKLND